VAFVKTHLPCNDCGSSDGLAINDDGWSHCFVCEARTPPETDVNLVNHREVRMEAKKLDTTHENYVTIIERGINSDTAKAYKCSKNGKDYHFNYTDDKGNVIACKTRTADKDFRIAGDWKSAGLYGQNLFSKGGKYVTIVEG